MAYQDIREASERLVAHLRERGIPHPIVGAGVDMIFVYAEKRDKERVRGLSEWEGVPVSVSIVGPIRAYADRPVPAPSLSAGESGR